MRTALATLVLSCALVVPAAAQIAPGSQPTPGADNPTRTPRPPQPRPLPPEQGPAQQPSSPLDQDFDPDDHPTPPLHPTTPAAAPSVTPADLPPPPQGPVAPLQPTAQAAYEPPAPDDPGVTSAAWQPSYHFEWHWRLLMLPEYIVDLALVPFELFVGAVQEHRWDKKFFRLLDIKSLGLKIAPRFKFAFGDGLGAGLWFKHAIDDSSKIKVGGLARLNADWQLEARYDHALLLPGGRGLRARAFIEKDRNERYYGIGNTTTKADRRVLAAMDEGALVEVDLQGIDRYTYSGIAQLGIRHQRLTKGDDASYEPVGEPGDNVIPPTGFNDSATYVDAQLVGRRDTRDTGGRPMRGLLLEAAVLARTDVTSKHLSAVTGSAAARLFIPVITNRRVLVFTLAGAAAAPLFPGDEIPLDSLTVVGRSNVRGYDRDRFRDRYAVVGSAEYRFPIYEYLQSQAGLDAFVFLDGGQIWGESAFQLSPLRYSYGGGIRGGHETTQLFEMTVGHSPEGFQFNIGVESVL